jgi:hypothetical protein
MRLAAPSGKLRRSQALIARWLLSPGRESRAALIAIVAFSVIGFPILVGLKLGQTIFMDSAEAFGWGRDFLGGYGRHPPLTGWIAGVWYRVFPAENWSSYALSRVMNGLCLWGVYLVAHRVLGSRRAIFVILILMVYPLFLGAKSDRYNNYQVLQAILPFVVWSFLVAYDKRTAFSGALLGLAGAAATLTIYSGLFGVLAVALAAIVHRDRVRFLASPAPYAAIAVYLLVLSPHLIWLFKHDFASIRFASGYIGNTRPVWSRILLYIGHHPALIGIPVALAAVSLWPWRFRRPETRARDGQHSLLINMVAVLTLGPVIAFAAFKASPQVDWGNPFFTLVPVALLACVPGLIVTRRAVATAAGFVAATLAGYLVAAVIYPVVNFRTQPEHSAYEPLSELTRQLTQEWRNQIHTPLPIVVSELELASEIGFYSPDRPRPLADFAPYQSPWIAYPGDLEKLGYAAVCAENNVRCAEQLITFDPHIAQIKSIRLTALRRFAGREGPPVTWNVWIVPPRP